jgi:hypothetical protein
MRLTKGSVLQLDKEKINRQAEKIVRGTFEVEAHLNLKGVSGKGKLCQQSWLESASCT